ncbi:MAG: DUF3047 domain-containing protein [Gammaproteobacteria bacterium]|nr:DUF3047 domain-containing protein [Gammaproteobacteria bacterium]
MSVPSRLPLAGAGILLAVAACLLPGRVPGTEGAATRTLFDASAFADADWRHVRFVNETRYAADALDGERVIEAVPAQSSSVLLRPAMFDIARCPTLEWRWAVTGLQPDADIRVRNKEDVGAALFVLFGEPVSPLGLRDVPTLRYVWTNSSVAAGSIVDSPFMPGVVRSIVVRSGLTADRQLVTEIRDVADDFRAAFGREPPAAVHAIGIFADNDQTGQPARSHFAWARALCGSR